MKKTTHIEALTQFASDIQRHGRKHSNKPVAAFAGYVGLGVSSYQFTRILTWTIAFYQDALNTLETEDITDRNRSTAESILKSIFVPFLPPFTNKTVEDWYSSAMSETNQSYLDLLNNIVIKNQPIFVPEPSDLSEYSDELYKILGELDSVDLPRWIKRDFEEAVQLTLVAIEKLPFVAHRIIRDAHASILSKLFSAVSPDQKKFIVRAATTINLVLAAFVMPHAAVDAASTYYGWAFDSAVDVKQIEACAAPLALPPPDGKAAE